MKRVPPTLGSWEPRNLAQVEERPPILPDLGGIGLVYPGKRHLFSGPPESAKTLVAYLIALEVVRAGGTVLVVDFEMGPYDARDRLRELGATDGDLARILYTEPWEPGSEAVVVALLEKHRPALLIVDAAAGTFSLHGFDDNRRADVERFAWTYIRPCFVRDVATIVLDHVGKDPKGRGPFAVGSERKVGGCDVHLGFETVKPLRRGGRGLFRIVTHKDRLGYLRRPTAALLEITSEPQTHALTWSLRDAASGDRAGDGWRPSVLMERISQFVEQQPRPVPRGTIEAQVRGKVEYLRQALDFLVADGYLVEQPGPRGSRLYVFERAYREPASERDLVPTSSPTSSREVVPDLVPTIPLRQADPDLVPTSSRPRPSPPVDLVPSPYRGDGVDGDEVDQGDGVEVETFPRDPLEAARAALAATRPAGGVGGDAR